MGWSKSGDRWNLQLSNGLDRPSLTRSKPGTYELAEDYSTRLGVWWVGTFLAGKRAFGPYQAHHKLDQFEVRCF